MKLIDGISFDKGPVPKMNGIFLRIYPPTLVDLMALFFSNFILLGKKISEYITFFQLVSFDGPLT